MPRIGSEHTARDLSLSPLSKEHYLAYVHLCIGFRCSRGNGMGQHAAAQEDKINQPPAGFTAVFNGQDLSGWYGMESVSPDCDRGPDAEAACWKESRRYGRSGQALAGGER